MEQTYIKDNQSVLIDSCNRFIYEVYVFVTFENTFSTLDHKYFSSKVEIPNIVESFYVNKNIEICCELYSAPKKWLIDNDFVLYIKPEKKKRNGQKIKINK